jgi:hypothetical protein
MTWTHRDAALPRRHHPAMAERYGRAFLSRHAGCCAARKPMLLREAHMQRNAPRYGVDLSNLMR